MIRRPPRSTRTDTLFPYSTLFRSADLREVLGVREEHAPAVAEPVMKADFALGGLRREIRRRAADGKCHAATPHESPRPQGREDAAPAAAHCNSRLTMRNEEAQRHQGRRRRPTDEERKGDGSGKGREQR